MFNRRAEGFTLVELMIVAGMMTITGLLFAQMTLDQRKSLAANQNRLVATQLQSLVGQALSNSTACLQMLGSAPAPTSTSTPTPLPNQTLGAPLNLTAGHFYSGVPIDYIGWSVQSGAGTGTQLLDLHIDYGGIHAGDPLTFNTSGATVPSSFGTGMLQSQVPGGLSAIKAIDISFTATVSSGVITACSSGGSISLGGLNCTTYESGPVGQNTLAAQPCSATYPYALSGGCNGPNMYPFTNVGRVNASYISSNTQYCFSQGGSIDAFVTCCK